VKKELEESGIVSLRIRSVRAREFPGEGSKKTPAQKRREAEKQGFSGDNWRQTTEESTMNQIGESLSPPNG
jgi:hypothetical protein